jgi:adenylate cyclase
MKNLPADRSAWLEDANHKSIPIQGSCSIGRSANNQLALSSDMVSRRHALIQVQHETEFWLVDFGSSNGTYLNNQRITQPTRLHHRDHLKIGPFEFVFHLAQSEQSAWSETIATDRTVVDIRNAKCWLLLADIINSTQLVKELALEELPKITGPWATHCKQIIETHGGRINQFMGDGFFAYWHDHERAEAAVGNALQELRQFQELSRPAFRIVLHYGEVALGGVSLGEEERISGKEVHFAFRLEKLAGRLGEVRLLSQAAWQKLTPLVQARDVGCHALAGFESKATVYAFD